MSNLTRKIVMATTASSTARSFVLGQAIFFAERGWQVHLVTSPDTNFAQLQREIPPNANVLVHAIQMLRNPSPVKDFRALTKWIALIREVRPDVVMASTPKAGLLGILSSRLLRVPTRIYLVRGLRYEGLTGFRLVTARSIEKLTCWAASSILCVSFSVQSKLHASRIVRTGTTAVLARGSSNGVDLDRFTPATSSQRSAARQTLGYSSDDFVVGYMGRLTPDKGLDYLIQAVSRLNVRGTRARLVVVGALDPTAPLSPESLTALAAKEIRQLPATSSPAEIYHALDVFCLPSLREGMPNVNLEAAASGLPVVTTDATGCRDSVRHDVTGLIVPTRDPVSLSNAISYLLDSPQVRETMGREGRQWVGSHFKQLDVWTRTERYVSEMHAKAMGSRENTYA